MATAGSSATNSYVNDSPGSTSGLGDGRDAVHRVVDVYPMQVQVGAHREFVVEHDAHTVADVEADLRSGHGAVVGPRLDRGARLDLPGRELGRELELLDTAGSHGRFEDLVAGAIGLGRVVGDRGVHGLGHLLVVLGVHLVAGVRRRQAARRTAAGRAAPPASVRDRERARHPGVGVAGDGADHLVLARFERGQVEDLAFPGVQVGARYVGAAHREVVGRRSRVRHLDGSPGGHRQRCGREGELAQLEGGRPSGSACRGVRRSVVPAEDHRHRCEDQGQHCDHHPEGGGAGRPVGGRRNAAIGNGRWSAAGGGGQRGLHGGSVL